MFPIAMVLEEGVIVILDDFGARLPAGIKRKAQRKERKELKEFHGCLQKAGMARPDLDYCLDFNAMRALAS